MSCAATAIALPPVQVADSHQICKGSKRETVSVSYMPDEHSAREERCPKDACSHRAYKLHVSSLYGRRVMPMALRSRTESGMSTESPIAPASIAKPAGCGGQTSTDGVCSRMCGKVLDGRRAMDLAAVTKCRRI